MGNRSSIPAVGPEFNPNPALCSEVTVYDCVCQNGALTVCPARIQRTARSSGSDRPSRRSWRHRPPAVSGWYRVLHKSDSHHQGLPGKCARAITAGVSLDPASKSRATVAQENGEADHKFREIVGRARFVPGPSVRVVSSGGVRRQVSVWSDCVNNGPSRTPTITLSMS
jgi:hypothetical protein